MLDYAIAFEEKAKYLHAIATGARTSANVARCLEEAQAEAVRRGFSRVLIEARFNGPRLDASAVLIIAEAASRRASGLFRAFAYVDEDAGDAVKLAETIAVNRGVPARLFHSLVDAEKWIDDRW